MPSSRAATRSPQRRRADLTMCGVTTPPRRLRASRAAARERIRRASLGANASRGRASGIGGPTSPRSGKPRAPIAARASIAVVSTPRQHVHVLENRVQLRDERRARARRSSPSRASAAMWRTSSIVTATIRLRARGWPARRRASFGRSSRRRSRSSTFASRPAPASSAIVPLPNFAMLHARAGDEHGARPATRPRRAIDAPRCTTGVPGRRAAGDGRLKIVLDVAAAADAPRSPKRAPVATDRRRRA